MNHDSFPPKSFNQRNPNEWNKDGISDADLLQANATVIASALIFVTISSISGIKLLPTSYTTLWLYSDLIAAAASAAGGVKSCENYPTHMYPGKKFRFQKIP